MPSLENWMLHSKVRGTRQTSKELDDAPMFTRFFSDTELTILWPEESVVK